MTEIVIEPWYGSLAKSYFWYVDLDANGLQKTYLEIDCPGILKNSEDYEFVPPRGQRMALAPFIPFKSLETCTNAHGLILSDVSLQ